MRIALAPVRHVTGRLPGRNVGRETVLAVSAMTPAPQVERVVDWAGREG